MRTLVVIVGLGWGILGSAAKPVVAAEPIGPLCLGLETFRDSFEVFLTPSGGANFLLSGRNREGGGPVIGSGYANAGAFTFYFLTPTLNQPGIVFRGTIDLTTLIGSGRCFVVDADTTACGGLGDFLLGVIPCS
jgi:hypothetical protein